MTRAFQAGRILVEQVRRVERGEIDAEQCVRNYYWATAGWRLRHTKKHALRRRWAKIFGPDKEDGGL